MVDRAREDNELREEFKVLGSTGNVSGNVRYETPSLTQQKCRFTL